MTVGDRIKKIRESKGMSQDDLARIMGYSSKSGISRTENSGDDIGTKRIMKFAEALDVAPSTLMGWDAEVPDVNNVEDHALLIALYDRCSLESRNHIMDYIRFLAGKDAK